MASTQILTNKTNIMFGNCQQIPLAQDTTSFEYLKHKRQSAPMKLSYLGFEKKIESETKQYFSPPSPSDSENKENSFQSSNKIIKTPSHRYSDSGKMQDSFHKSPLAPITDCSLKRLSAIVEESEPNYLSLIKQTESKIRESQSSKKKSRFQIKPLTFKQLSVVILGIFVLFFFFAVVSGSLIKHTDEEISHEKPNKQKYVEPESSQNLFSEEEREFLETLSKYNDLRSSRYLHETIDISDKLDKINIKKFAQERVDHFLNSLLINGEPQPKSLLKANVDSFIDPQYRELILWEIDEILSQSQSIAQFSGENQEPYLILKKSLQK